MDQNLFNSVKSKSQTLILTRLVIDNFEKARVSFTVDIAYHGQKQKTKASKQTQRTEIQPGG